MRTSPFFFAVLAFVGFLSFAGGSPARAEGSIETRGTLTRPQDGQISPNLWAGMERDDAVLLIRSLPARYSSPVYYEIARRFLLTDSAPLPAAKPADKDALKPTGYEVLVARLDKLLEMGALRDAQTLYDSVVTDIPDDFDLVYRNLQMLMLRGQLSAACLDLQAMQSQHGNDPRWKEFNTFCRIQFAQGAERERLLAGTKFTYYPKLNDFLRGRGLGDVRRMNVSDLAFAAGVGAVGPSSIALLSPSAGSMSPLLLAVLLQMDTAEAVPQKTCLAIEAARRGLASTRDLITIYEKPHYDAALLLDNIGSRPSTANIHPCMIPTVLYQRIASNPQQPARDIAIRAALDVMADLPDAALWPMATYFRDMDVRAAANKKYLWRATQILAYEKGDLPDEWSNGWGGQSKGVGGGVGVSPFWPVQAIIRPDASVADQMAVWKDQWPTEARRVDSRDPIIPLLLGQYLSGKPAKTGKKTKSELDDYENISSLTFSRSYAMPSYGLTQRLSDVIEKGQTGQSVALLLIGYGAIPPDQVIPHQMALVIDGMNKAGLAQYARRFALEVLR